MTGWVQGRSMLATGWFRYIFGAALLLLAGLLACAALVVAPYLFKGATLQSELAEQVRSATGLSLRADGPARFELLPQPHIEMADLHFADPSGTVAIDADALEGEVRFLPLLVGRLEVASATLTRPRLAIDLDGKPVPADSTIGRALHGAGPQAEGSRRLGVVTLVDGTALLKSRMFARGTHVDKINVTVDWRNLDAPASVTGNAEFNGAALDLAAWVGEPSSLLRGDHSAVALRVHSTPLDLSANGDFVGTPAPRFKGHVSASAPALKDALALFGYRVALPAPFAGPVLTSDAVVGSGGIDLPNLHLRLDGNDFEGTLAYQAGDPRPSLSGTLATDQLTLTPFLANAPPLLDADHHWSRQALNLDLHDSLNLDLRVSATHLRLPPILIDDAALAVMTRDDRTEIALVEGKAYGGAVKGRASVGMTGSMLSLRAAGALTDADVSAMSWDVFGRQLATGTLTASANLEAAGATTADLLANLHGWVKGRAHDGELSGVDLGHGLREIARERFEAALPALRNGRTPFDSLAFNLQVADGVATVDQGALKGPEAQLTVDGKADIAHRLLDLHAAAEKTGATPPVRLGFGIGGSFDQTIVMPSFDTTPAPVRP